MTKSSAHLVHLHNFRGFAIALIIATHCLSGFDWSASPLMESVLKRLVANGTILFLFIAGFLFQHLSDRYQVSDYLLKKARYVVLPYIIVSLPALIVFTVVMPRPDMPSYFYDFQPWEKVGFFLVTGSHLAPFWFIPTIILFYLASPALHWLDRQGWFYYLLPLALLIPVFVSRGYLDPLKSFVHFIPVWMLGMACSRYREVAAKWLKYLLWPLMVVFAILFACEMAFAKGTHSWYSSIGKIVLTLCLYEMFRRWGERGAKWFGLAGTLSFGLFFLHSYVISSAKLLIERFSGGLPTGSLIGYFLASISAMVLSIFVVQVVRFVLPGQSRQWIGV